MKNKIHSLDQVKDEEKYIVEAIISARKIQEFLWGKCNGEWGLEEWRRMFKKRLIKIDEIVSDNPHAMIELRKRILQNTALGIALLRLIDENSIKNKCDIPSNLEKYK